MAAAVALGLAAAGAHAAPRKRAVAHAAPKKAAAPAPLPLPGPPFPNFASAGQVAQACSDGIAGANQRVKALEKRRPGLDWLKGWDDLYAWQEDRSNALIFLKNVSPNADIRTAAEACDGRWLEFSSALGLNEAVYGGGAKSLPLLKDAIDRRAVQVALEAFEDSGVTLPADKRPRAKELSDKLDELGQTFARNIRDGHLRVAFTEAELKGVPDAVWKDKPRDADGKVLLGIDNPTYFPVVQLADDPAARERMWRAKLTEGGADNLKVLAQIEKARLEYARLFGYASFAEFQLRRRMVETPARAAKFLDDVHGAVADQEKHDIAELREAKAHQLGKPVEAVRLERWDTAYYDERLRRERYSVDDDAFRPYFPPQESLRFVMRVAEKLFNLRYDRVDGSYWAPEVQAYAVVDLASGKKISTLYIDPYPRDGKFNHAAVWPLRNSSTAVDRAPQAALVVNLDRRGLSLRELETLMYEFGHTLHVDLSATRYASDGGMNVMQDFVEVPSQVFEDWVYDKKVLKLFADVCPACKPVPDDLVDKARAARDLGKGLAVARQHLYASYDLALHGPNAPDPMDTWSKMEGATPLGTVPGTMFPAGFAHIAGGYGAGYYGYLWSQVVATDMRTAFGTDRLDAKVGARLRADILSQGGQKPPQQLVHDFLGRDTNPQAFFDSLHR